MGGSHKNRAFNSRENFADVLLLTVSSLVKSPPFQARLAATILAGLNRDLRAISTSWSRPRDRISSWIKTSHLVRGNYTGRIPRRANKQGCQLTPGRLIKASDWRGNTQTAACRRRPTFGSLWLTCLHADAHVCCVRCSPLLPPPSVEWYERGWKMERNQSRLWPWQSCLHVKLLRVNGAEQQRCSWGGGTGGPGGPCSMCLSCDSSIKTLPLSLTALCCHFTF